MTAVFHGSLSARAVVALSLFMLFSRGQTAVQVYRQFADEELTRASPFMVAQCRAGCLQKLVPHEVEAAECENKSDCWECWNYCEVLQTEGKNEDKKSICEHNCDSGCQVACSFEDWDSESQPCPVEEAHGEQTLTVESGTLRWPNPDGPDSGRRFVYVIMRRREPGTRRTWAQLGQTTEREARLPKNTAPCTVRVLAVCERGLVTVFSPAPVVLQLPTATATGGATAAPKTAVPSTASTLHDLRDADIIIKSLGRDQILGIQLPLAARSASQEESLRLMGDDPSDSSEVWNLREVSMIHQKVLVLAEVAWDARQVRRPAYLVTWEIAGGGLKGSLFTDTTCVTLSLWPDTAYLIQVSLLGGADRSVKMSISPTLLLDTRSAVHPVVDVTTTVAADVSDEVDDDVVATNNQLTAPVAVVAGLGYRDLQLVAVAGAGAAVLLFVGLVLVYSRTNNKIVQREDSERPPLLDDTSRPLDFAKYLGSCRKYRQLVVEEEASHQEKRVLR